MCAIRDRHTLRGMNRSNRNGVWLGLVVALVLLVSSGVAFADVPTHATAAQVAASQPHPTPDPHP